MVGFPEIEYKYLSIFLSLCWKLSVLLLLGVLLYYAQASRRPKNFPPGPSTVPLLGNLYIFPKTKGFLKFHEWGKRYGSIIGLKLGTQNVVVLNDYKHVQELFDKRGGKYSDRPPSHVTNDIIYPNNTHILFLPYGEDWRVLRKTLQRLLNAQVVDELLPIQDAEAVRTMHQLCVKPEAWYDHVRRYPTAVILASVFGVQGQSFGSPRVEALYHAQDEMTKIVEIGATPPIDVYPWLKKLPDFLSPWRRWARSIRAEKQALWFALMDEGKRQMEKPRVHESFLARMIRDQEKNGLDDEHIAYLAGTLMEAGSDPTATTILSFVLAMVKHPQALQKCQEEIDLVCGKRRSPTIEDVTPGKSPYLHATLEETLRWRPAAAGGIPHALTEDDVYEGYHLPKGTIMFANTWSIHRTSEYDRPEEFIPERFLQSKFGITSDQYIDGDDTKRRVHYGFGAGRRVCSGQHMAENAMILNMAKLVWTFDILPGEGLIRDDIETGFHDGLLVAPKEFPLRLNVRSAEHLEVINKEHIEALQFLSQFAE